MRGCQITAEFAGHSLPPKRLDIGKVPGMFEGHVAILNIFLYLIIEDLDIDILGLLERVQLFPQLSGFHFSKLSLV